MIHRQDDIPDALIEQAIAWSVKLHAGTDTRHLTQACDAWRAEAADHERAWQSIQQIEAPFVSMAAAGAAGTAVRNVARLTLERAQASPNPARRRAIRHVVIAASASALGYAGYVKFLPPGEYTTRVAQRRTIRLADGTRLVLNASSAVDVRYDAVARTVVLRRGEILVETGHRSPDGQALPPFWVETPQGRMQALGTRFIVTLGERNTLVQVEDGTVAVYANGAGQSVLVHPGESRRIDADGSTIALPAAPEASAWTDGTVIAQSMRLGDLIDRLGRYRYGWLNCSPDVADLRVSGVFRLDDTDLALSALANSLPVRIVRRTDYWVRVMPA